MKVIWLSNVDVLEENKSTSGTWVSSLANALCKAHSEITLINYSFSVNKETGKKSNNYNLEQRFVRRSICNNNSEIADLLSSFETENPDLFHVWGTESPWLGIINKKVSVPVILDMQGVVDSVYENFYGGLGGMDLIRCLGIKELLRPKSYLPMTRRIYKPIADKEKAVIQWLSYVSVQSDWVAAYIRSINTNCKIYKTGIVLREEFYRSSKWSTNDGTPTIFTTATMVSPLKGLHLLLKALVIVKKYYPNIKLKIAGAYQSGIKIGGYGKLILHFIKKNNLTNNVVFLGELNATQLISEFQSASVFVNPSYIESYSLVVAEAMHIGVPCVATFVGGMAELGDNNVSIFYFPKDDYISCSSKILDLLNHKSLSKIISEESIRVSDIRDNCENIISNQIAIYQSVIGANK